MPSTVPTKPLGRAPSTPDALGRDAGAALSVAAVPCARAAVASTHAAIAPQPTRARRRSDDETVQGLCSKAMTDQTKSKGQGKSV